MDSDAVIDASSIIRELLDLVRTAQAENVRLTNIVLQHLGVSVVEGDTTVTVRQLKENNSRVRVGAEPWPVYKQRLEKRFRNRIDELEPEVLDFAGSNKGTEQHAETDQRHSQGVHNGSLDSEGPLQEGLHDKIQEQEK